MYNQTIAEILWIFVLDSLDTHIVYDCSIINHHWWSNHCMFTMEEFRQREFGGRAASHHCMDSCVNKKSYKNHFNTKRILSHANKVIFSMFTLCFTLLHNSIWVILCRSTTICSKFYNNVVCDWHEMPHMCILNQAGKFIAARLRMNAKHMKETNFNVCW